MFNETSGLGEETRDERLARICPLKNRWNNPKCLAAGYVQGSRVRADASGNMLYDSGPAQPQIQKPVLTGDVVTPTTAPMASSGVGIMDTISSLPSWVWLAGGGLLLFTMMKKR